VAVFGFKTPLSAERNPLQRLVWKLARNTELLLIMDYRSLRGAQPDGFRCPGFLDIDHPRVAERFLCAKVRYARVSRKRDTEAWVWIMRRGLLVGWGSPR